MFVFLAGIAAVLLAQSPQGTPMPRDQGLHRALNVRLRPMALAGLRRDKSAFASRLRSEKEEA
jgi:hypothetical protein